MQSKTRLSGTGEYFPLSSDAINPSREEKRRSTPAYRLGLENIEILERAHVGDMSKQGRLLHLYIYI
jgi:hypothetical protein